MGLRDLRLTYDENALGQRHTNASYLGDAGERLAARLPFWASEEQVRMFVLQARQNDRNRPESSMATELAAHLSPQFGVFLQQFEREVEDHYADPKH